VIKAEPTLPYTAEANVVAERLNGTLFERTLAVMLYAEAEKNLWGDAIMAVSHTANLSPTTDGKTTPRELFCRQKPDVSHLRVLGSLEFALRLVKQQRQLDSWVLLGTHVRYATGCHGLSIILPISGRMRERHDIFAEEAPKGRPLRLAGLRTQAYICDDWGSEAAGSSSGMSGGSPPGVGSTPEEEGLSPPSSHFGSQSCPSEAVGVIA